jgi:hypothetical protein
VKRFFFKEAQVLLSGLVAGNTDHLVADMAAAAEKCCEEEKDVYQSSCVDKVIGAVVDCVESQDKLPQDKKSL